jgi:transmembrane sensor
MRGVEAGRTPHSIKAEAAAWLARLHSEDRRSDDEAGFRTWLAEDSRHARAFELVTTAWEASGARVPDSGARRAFARSARRRTLALGAMVALASIAAISLGFLHGLSADTYATQVGEQRSVALDDGSHVILDTNTLIRVTLGEERRSVELLQGRAHFEVATDALRPFLVRAGDQQVIAIGTAFDVSRQGDRVSIVLVEGRIEVQATSASARPFTRLDAPGARITFESAGAVAQDHPDLTEVTAWQDGREVFDDQTLASAVAAMNRYTRRPIVIADESLASRRISGVYGTKDPEAFARSVTILMPARVEFSPTQILLRAAEEN